MNSALLLKIVWAPALVLILHVIVTVTGLYESLWWMDIPAHFLGGCAIVISTSYVLDYFHGKGQFSVNWIPLNILILLAFVGMAAAAWEVLEFGLDRYLGTSTQVSLLDTIKDLCMGISGGGLTAIILIIKKQLK